jgi:hypothetical protein
MSIRKEGEKKKMEKVLNFTILKLSYSICQGKRKVGESFTL